MPDTKFYSPNDVDVFESSSLQVLYSCSTYSDINIIHKGIGVHRIEIGLTEKKLYFYDDPINGI